MHKAKLVKNHYSQRFEQITNPLRTYNEFEQLINCVLEPCSWHTKLVLPRRQFAIKIGNLLAEKNVLKFD